MAKAKSVLTKINNELAIEQKAYLEDTDDAFWDENYENWNRLIAEQEANVDSDATELTILHDDGSIWYSGRIGGTDTGFLKPRLRYPALPYSIVPYCDALDRCAEVADDENGTLDDIVNAVNAELAKTDDKAIKAALYFYLGSRYEEYENCDEEMLECCGKALAMFREVTDNYPTLSKQYIAGILDAMGVTLLRLERYDEAEAKFKEGLEFCRLCMIDYSPIDWTYHTLIAYHHLALLYERQKKLQKAKAYIEECWRTYEGNDVTIARSFYYMMIDHMVRIYQLCGETDKAESFWRDNGISPLARFLQEQEIEIPGNDTPDSEISARVQQVLQNIAFASRDNLVDYIEQLCTRTTMESLVSELHKFIGLIKDANPWPENQITNVDSITNGSWLMADLGVVEFELSLFFIALYIELGQTVDSPLLLGDFEDCDEDDEQYKPNFDTTEICTAPKLGEVKAFIEWALTEDAE